MSKFKVGDEIEILRGNSNYYNVGAKGVLVHCVGQDWVVDFSSSEEGSYDTTKDMWFANTWRFDPSLPERG